MDATSKFITTNNTEKTNFVAIKQLVDASSAAAGVTVTAKSNTTAFTGGAGTNTLLRQWVKNGRETLDWIARDDNDFFRTKASSSQLCLTIAHPTASTKMTVTMVHEE
jgi:hypothetical protein